MAIEIKELVIKVKIEEEKSSFPTQNAVNGNQQQIATLKSEIIKECMAKVLEKLKEREER